MAEFPTNLWAPWRLEYVQALSDDDKDGCFLCKYRDEPENDPNNHVIWRCSTAMLVMNRFPYSNGHLLIAPLAHKGEMEELSPEEMRDVWWQTREAKELLVNTIGPQGFNIGLNIGRCAGAGLPGHVHIHVVPRWNGDTNFMSVIGDARVIPQALDALYQKLTKTAKEKGLPRGAK